MIKLISIISVLALAVVRGASTSHTAPESEVEAETEVEPDNSYWPWTDFHSWIDATNETQEDLKHEEAPGTDDDRDTDYDRESEVNETATFSQSGGQRIKSGYATNIKKHPYQVSVILHRFHLKYLCSGSIISNQWVLTAAHCSMGAPSEFIVRSGSRYYKTGGYPHKVSSIYVHYLFSPKTLDYDIGVMHIAGIFEYNDFVQPIPLAKSLPKPGAPVAVAGWGLTSAVNLTVTTQEVCNKSFPGVTPRQFCAGFTAGGRGACYGDSGAPLVAGGEQVGLVSSGKCELRNVPTVFMSVPKFRKWIRYYTGV